MIPITRKEKYINQIVGGGDTAPETPQTREEFFYADILGEVIAPSPVTRTEKYLSAIAGQYSGDLPTPTTRIEYFLARAAGMDVNAPTPVTREEMFWDMYTAVKEIIGTLPLTFKARKSTTLDNYRIYGNTETKTRSYSGSAPLSFPIVDGGVSNYRIYGNTVNGESVGDLVTDGQSEHYGNYAIPISNNSETASIYLDKPLRMVGDEAEYVDYAEQKWHRVRKNLVSDYNVNATKTRYDPVLHCFADLMPNTNYIITFLMDSQTDFYTNEYVFEPTRYTNKLPGNKKLIVKTKETLNKNDIRQYRSAYGWIILKNNSEQTENPNISYVQIRLTSIEDDTYEPYIENTEVDVTIPALPAQSSTNSLSVGTAVQPSSVAVDVAEVVSCGDRTVNILPLSRTPITETHGDFLCEYDGFGSITLTTNKDNASTKGAFIIPLMRNFTIPVSVGQGGTGCFQINNSAYGNSLGNIWVMNNNTEIDRWALTVINRTNSIYTGMGNKIVNQIKISIVNSETYRKITIKPAFVENVTEQVLFEPYGYKIPVTLTADSTETTDIYLDEPLRKVGNESDYIDYAEQKQHRVRKNLLENTATSQTKDGVTFTVNSDGSVTCNGTSVGDSVLLIPVFTLPAGRYILNGCPNGGDQNTTFKLLVYANDVWRINDTGLGGDFTLTESSTITIKIRIYIGYTCDNLTFYPMIRKADIEDDTYEPYIENTEVDVTIPAISTLAGTNTLTVGTEVQPSSVEIKGRIQEVTP